jgi:predicted dehydrogenase
MPLTRRRFLAAAAAAAASAPYVITSAALGAGGRPAASNRIGLASVGVGGRGGYLLRGTLGDSDCMVLGVCDADASRLSSAKDTVQQRYTQEMGRTYAGCKDYRDFREVLARPDVDAVVIATPDHWHGMLSMMAAKAGKDIYCEKPVASTITDGRASADAVRRYGRVFQTGSHERSTASIRYACELVRNGRLGKLHTVRTFLPTGQKSSGATGAEPVPAGFDYNMWLGPAPWAPYHRRRCHGSFRWVQDYSDGELTDRGAHVNDIALLGAGPFLKGPATIEGRGKFLDDPLWDVAYEYHIEWTFANGIRWICSSDDAPVQVICNITKAHRGVLFEGTDGWVFVAIHGGALSASRPDLLKEVIGPDEVRLGRSIGHLQDWLRAIKTRGPTMAPAEDGHRTASFCHLCNIACILHRKLVWDFDKERFIDDDSANAMTHRPPRSPWRL